MRAHHIRGAVIAGIGGLGLGTMMFLPRFLHFGLLYGLILLLAVIAGVLDFLGAIHIKGVSTETQPRSEPIETTDGSPFWARIFTHFEPRLFYVGVALLCAATCRLSVRGTLGAEAPLASALVLILVGAAFFVAARIRRRPFDGNWHPGFLVFSLATAAIMATLGSQGLWDPWETHYGEVARRQLEQDDWISLYWEKKWFFSKPILIFWLMNLGMLLFGVKFGPDQVSGHAEWGVRFFVAAISIAVIMGVYSLASRRISKRAGVFSAVVLATSPIYGFMSRQAITDLPFVGFMTLGVVFFLLAITAKKDAVVKNVFLPVGRGKALELNGFHGLVAGYVAVGVPQFLYLLTRHDAFVSGTLGRGALKVSHAKEHLIDGLAGAHLSDLFNVSTLVESWFGLNLPVDVDISLNWFLLGLAFLVPFGLILTTLRKERRVSRICLHAMFICLALSVMAKGAAGLIIPLLGIVAYFLVIVPWPLVLNPKLIPVRLGGVFVPLFSGTNSPRELLWIVAMWTVRQVGRLRGFFMFLLLASPWYVAMYFRHGYPFIQRFFVHDHLKRLAQGVHGERGTFQYFVEQLGYGAFPWVGLLPFALFAWPGLFPRREERTPDQQIDRTIRLFLTCFFLTCFALLSFMTTKFHHYVFPLVPSAAILVGLFLDDVWSKKIPRIGAVVVVAAAVVVVIAKDLIVDPDVTKGVAEGYAKLLGLFIYKYERDFPSGAAYDFGLPIFIFSGLFLCGVMGWLVKWRRRTAIVVTLLVALGFGHFLYQHYMVSLAPHWTQRHLIDEYYAKRTSKKERLVAFQMNWKGENFYTGNRVIVHVSTKNKNFDKWCDKHRGERHFFITEYGRWENMNRRAKAKSGDLVQFKDVCNKYRAGFADEL